VELYYIIFSSALGAIIGSFLNVLILRHGTSRSLLGWSSCLSCAKKLEWYELIPIVSFFVLRGRCASCKNAISLQYPIVEALTALVFVLIFFKTYPSLVLFFFFAAVFSILIAIAVYDFRHKIIPDPFVFVFIALSFGAALFRFLTYEIGFDFYLNIVGGPLLFLPFFLLWYFSKGRLMGLGDGKLALGIGWLFGFTLGFSAIILGFWLGAAVALCLLAYSRLWRGRGGFTMKSEIPFGPFLILGTLSVFVTDFNFFALGLGF